jgi:hypothetical protein
MAEPLERERRWARRWRMTLNAIIGERERKGKMTQNC